jgi:hypothetical protein
VRRGPTGAAHRRRAAGLSPSELVEQGYLDVQPAEFKLNVILWAAQDWNTNRRHLNRLVAASTLSAGLGLQVAFFALWVLLG